MDLDGLDQRTLERLIGVGRALVVRLDLESVLELVLDAGREVTGARYAALGVLDEHGRHLERFLTLGVDEETRHAIGRPPHGRGVLGELIRTPKPLRLADVGAHPGSYGFPPGHPRMSSFLGVPILVRGEAWGNLYLTEKRGGEFDHRDEQAVVVLADWAAIAIENARLYEGLARRRDRVELQRNQAERSVRALEAMTDIARSVGDETRLDRILELIVKRGRALVECRALFILLATGEDLTVAATAGDLEVELRGRRAPFADTVLGQVLRQGQPQRLLGDSAPETGLARLGISADAAIVVPLSFRGVPSGVLVAVDREIDGPDFGAEDERLLSSFAASAATAVATAKTVEAERLRHSLAAAERERKRWARELHDETLQALGGLRMLYSASLRGTSAEEMRAAIEQGVELIDEEIDNLSSLIVELRPAALDQIGLAPALRTLAERRSRRGGPTIDVLVRLNRDGSHLPSEIENTIYRLSQEALSNAAKHAEAERVELMVEHRGATVEVTVRDDGVGFSVTGVEGGFGLIGMRERVELTGGELRIESASGQGTTIRASIPLEG